MFSETYSYLKEKTSDPLRGGRIRRKKEKYENAKEWPRSMNEPIKKTAGHSSCLGFRDEMWLQFRDLHFR